MMRTAVQSTRTGRALSIAQYNALVGLAAGQTPEEVWAEVAQYARSEPVDTGNLIKAMERTPSRVVFVDSNSELERILEHPFALWRTFLHPAHRKIAYATQCAGTRPGDRCRHHSARRHYRLAG
jgi:hypothetical protein